MRDSCPQIKFKDTLFWHSSFNLYIYFSNHDVFNYLIFVNYNNSNSQKDFNDFYDFNYCALGNHSNENISCFSEHYHFNDSQNRNISELEFFETAEIHRVRLSFFPSDKNDK